MIDIIKIISEARRGRPRKNAEPSKDEEGGREHIVVQLRKSENLRGEKHIEFNDNSKHKVPLEHVKKALNMHQNMKPIPKGDFEKRLATSHASFMSAIKGEKAPAAKPKVSLGSMKKEGWMHIGPADGKSPYDRFGDKRPGTITLGNDEKFMKKDKEEPSSSKSKVINSRLTVKKEAVDNYSPTEPGQSGSADVNTMKSDRGNLKTYVTVGTDGRVKLVKHREHRKEIKVESVSVNMQQDSLNKLKKEPQSNPKEIKTLPPTQGNKPVGGEDQVHTGKFSVAEETILNTLYINLNEENKLKFDSLCQTEDGVKKLLDFAKQQGLE